MSASSPHRLSNSAYTVTMPLGNKDRFFVSWRRYNRPTIVESAGYVEIVGSNIHCDTLSLMNRNETTSKGNSNEIEQHISQGLGSNNPSLS